MIRDEYSDQKRFTGISHNPRISSCGALYGARKYHAEGNAAHAVFNTKAAVRALKPVPAVELSSHNVYGVSFVNSVGAAAGVRSVPGSTMKGSVSLWNALTTASTARYRAASVWPFCQACEKLGLNRGLGNDVELLEWRSHGCPAVLFGAAVGETWVASKPGGLKLRISDDRETPAARSLSTGRFGQAYPLSRDLAKGDEVKPPCNRKSSPR